MKWGLKNEWYRYGSKTQEPEKEKVSFGLLGQLKRTAAAHFVELYSKLKLLSRPYSFTPLAWG